MANTVDAIIPRILTRGLQALRAQLVAPRLVNRDYNQQAARAGNVVSIPIPRPKRPKAAQPSHNDPAPSDATPETANIPLDQWRYDDFHITDQEVDQIMASETYLPVEADMAVTGLATEANAFVLGRYFDAYGFVGSAGVSPFATDVDARNVLGRLTEQEAPLDDFLYGVVDATAQTRALGLEAFRDASASADPGVITRGRIGTKFGITWYQSNGVASHTAGTLTGNPVTQAAAAGASSFGMTCDADDVVALKRGDIITIAGDDQTYAVGSDVDIASSATGNVPITPKLQQAVAAGTAVTVTADHVVNLGFHRDGLAFITRPLGSGIVNTGSPVLQVTDADTGISLQQEVVRQHLQTTFKFSILYGAAVIRPELVVRLAG